MTYLGKKWDLFVSINTLTANKKKTFYIKIENYVISAGIIQESHALIVVNKLDI